MRYLLRHFQVFVHTLGTMFRQPVPALMTVMVLGITLSLPVGLYLLTHNLQRVSQNWHSQPQATVYLNKRATDQDVFRLENWFVTQRSWISKINYVSSEQALEEFKALSGLESALEILNENPLPNMFVLTMAQDFNLASYRDELEQLEGDFAVDQLKYDLEWVQRLQSILSLAQRSVLMVAGLLGLGVLFIISNTIRLSIANRRDEIIIINRVGATNAFIKRPFLYAGFLQGFLGALVAWLLIFGALSWLNPSVQRLSALYASDFKLDGVPLYWMLTFLLLGGLLGWLASWITVTQHLNKLYPE